MRNEEYKTFIIDGEEDLPFVLRLIIGHEEKGESILLHSLCQSYHHMAVCMYEVPELKPLRLQLQCTGDQSVTFVWNKVYEGRKQDMEWRYELHSRQRTVLLYEHGKTDYAYPWRCGLYHFEVHVQGDTYYGAFRIVPKNFQDEGLTLIQQTVERVMGSLIMDRGQYKKTFSNFADLEDHPQMAAIRALSKQTAHIRKQYERIMRTEFREIVYKRGAQQRRQDDYTIRQNAKLAARGTKAYCNRHYEPANERLRYIQYRVQLFVQQVRSLLLFLQEMIQKLERMQQSSQAERQAVQTILQAIERNGSVTERDKQKYRNILPLKDTEGKKIAVKLREYKVMSGILQHFFTAISSWVEAVPQEPAHAVPPAALHPQERAFLQLLELSQVKRRERTVKPAFLLVHKPTFLLYEYYMYFAVIEALQELGFQPPQPIAEQIQEYFYLDGLQDGTTVSLVYQDAVLKIAFNELIETHPLIALSKGSHFYNGEDTKKPDIRLDWHKKQGADLVYQSSIIIEVKYSPMYNIFQSVGNTKATEQMYKYWTLKYVREQDGKRLFHRRAVHEVICVYPGSQVHARRIDAGCGIFLQFYPYRTKQGQEQVMGKRELLRIVREWLSLPE